MTNEKGPSVIKAHVLEHLERFNHRLIFRIRERLQMLTNLVEIPYIDTVSQDIQTHKLSFIDQGQIVDLFLTKIDDISFLVCTFNEPPCFSVNGNFPCYGVGIPYYNDNPYTNLCAMSKGERALEIIDFHDYIPGFLTMTSQIEKIIETGEVNQGDQALV